jgi:hypothetical protein
LFAKSQEMTNAPYSLGLALAYGVLATAYILVSSTMAADHSASVDELRRIETLKGTIYVAVTTLGVFFGGLIAMRRMARDAEELVRRERALVASEGKVFAGVMAASVAHDANNVLTAVLADLESLSVPRDGFDGEARASVANQRRTPRWPQQSGS